jgi:multiple sugar transport system permease protein
VSPRLYRRLSNAAALLLLVALVAPFLLVFAWMAMASFQTSLQITAWPPTLLFTPTLANYEKVLRDLPIPQYTVNSILVSGAATFIGLLVGVPAAHGIARWRHRTIASILLATRMAPWISFLLPWYLIFSWLGLVGSRVTLIITHLIITVPMTTWLLIGFFEDLPRDLEDAALIDGCSHYQTFARILVPLVTPGIAAAAILSLIYSWNNFIFALILAGPRARTLPITVTAFISYQEVDWGATLAAATLITLPVLILALALQRFFASGLALGGLKG